MVLGITLITLSLIGLIYGIMRKNNTMIVASVIALIILAIIWLVYSYLYSLTPY